MTTDEFWNNVKSLLKENDMSQIELANACDIPYKTLQGWITKKVLPDIFQAHRMSEALKVSVDQLATGKKPVMSNKDILEYLKKLVLLTSGLEKGGMSITDMFKDIAVPNLGV